MAERANVSSVDSIEAFRTALIGYLAKTRPILEDASDEVSRTRQWLQTDRRMHWEGQLRRRAKVLQEAEQAVFSARLSNLRETTSAELAAVQRAKRAVQEAEEKLRLIKRWNLEFDHRVDPLVKQLESLRTMLGNVMPRAVAHLGQMVQTLDAYSGVAAPVADAAVPPPEQQTEAGQREKEET